MWRKLMDADVPIPNPPKPTFAVAEITPIIDRHGNSIEAHRQWTDFTSRIGYGDDQTEPAIKPDELVEVIGAQLRELRDAWEDIDALSAQIDAAEQARRDGVILGRLTAFRCPDCHHDHVLHGNDQTWDLDDSDYADEGSCER